MLAIGLSFNLLLLLAHDDECIGHLARWILQVSGAPLGRKAGPPTVSIPVSEDLKIIPEPGMGESPESPSAPESPVSDGDGSSSSSSAASSSPGAASSGGVHDSLEGTLR